ncbi:hypothetical protein LEP1GSC199_3415 [Leptospira vanthielii serovar Holland str. Waz Holland = ATCC 700522]|uniref:Uncharacterized protein n=1 Tax=Leptospira vanthielii serovar Holland str. Waz Holland = ATCC 700522 TaxID=1218591 RepID=N1VYW5_9LEPT|nr:hypothetical protein LEP1GSC199_3415 [Leptospira vanthielii serovar Holland str. Waz Holland = ATCC 700522]
MLRLTKTERERKKRIHQIYYTFSIQTIFNCVLSFFFYFDLIL